MLQTSLSLPKRHSDGRGGLGNSSNVTLNAHIENEDDDLMMVELEDGLATPDRKQLRYKKLSSNSLEETSLQGSDDLSENIAAAAAEEEEAQPPHLEEQHIKHAQQQQEIQRQEHQPYIPNRPGRTFLRTLSDVAGMASAVIILRKMSVSQESPTKASSRAFYSGYGASPRGSSAASQSRSALRDAMDSRLCNSCHSQKTSKWYKDHYAEGKHICKKCYNGRYKESRRYG